MGLVFWKPVVSRRSLPYSTSPQISGKILLNKCLVANHSSTTKRDNNHSASLHSPLATCTIYIARTMSHVTAFTIRWITRKPMKIAARTVWQGVRRNAILAPLQDISIVICYRFKIMIVLANYRGQTLVDSRILHQHPDYVMPVHRERQGVAQERILTETRSIATRSRR